ncbi:MAG TPA: caspase family protein [Burkholderiales bacterium]|nr:caspase family protein [Burkholderiales bacterium]
MGRNFCLAGLLLAASAALAQSGERTLSLVPKQATGGEARTALVIGNGAYANGPLRNPVNDARAMSKALGGAGFEVILVENATQAGMQRAIRAFGDKISKGGVGLFYYAGHGIQARGRNYLIPVNADIAREYEIEFGSIDVNLVLAMMDTAKNPLNIVILDACRNNPFARNFRSLQTGLAQIDAPTGTFIAFATAPGSVAADGFGDNGVYTKHLLAEMAQPGVPIELMFKQVRNGVMSETKGQQIPWESSSLRGEFTFYPGAAPSVAEAVAAALRREREAQQAEMQKLQAALDRQQKQLAALGLKPSPVPQVITPLEPVTPVVTASAAPTAVAASNSKLPQPGDTWTYRLFEPKRADGPKQRQYVVTVAAASSSSVLDKSSLEQDSSGEWAHTVGSYLVAQGKSLFAPYLSQLSELRVPMSIGKVVIADPACAGSYQCQASARVVGRETLRTPAGSFDTIRVEVEHNWQPASVSGGFVAQLNGGRKLTVWYAPAVKRAVKFSSRPTFGSLPPIDTYFDLELTSYQLK